MRANVIYHDNGVGLRADAELISDRLRHLGFAIMHSEYYEYQPPPNRVDLNVQLEVFDPFWLEHAGATYLIPNQEWLSPEWLPAISKIDGVLCKTRFAQNVLRDYGLEPSYIGFTSRDRYRPSIDKDYGRWLHFAGRSGQKGTATVIAAWMANPSFPPLTIVHHPENRHVRECLDGVSAPNIHAVADYLSDEDVDEVLNSHGVHICPSETEGFGHSLNEALACKAVVLTTDAPPMNELVTGQWGVPVPWDECAEDPEQPGITRRYRVSAHQLARSVRRAMQLSRSACEALGERAREQFRERDRSFAAAFDRLILGRRIP